MANAPAAAAGWPRTAMNEMSPRLWLADIAPAHQPAWSERHASWLSPSEQARWQRINRPQRRAQFLAGHILLRRMAATVSRIVEREVGLEVQADGRPVFVDLNGWRPSLAHSRQWVAALLDAGEVDPGVDIEFMRPGRQIEAIAKMACAVDPTSRDDAYLLWAQREAQLKAGATPTPAGAWVATWCRHALAVCASAPPSVELIDLTATTPACAVDLTWASRSRLQLGQANDGR